MATARTFVAFKGITAYEVQVGRAWAKVVHLRGHHWRFRPWRRFSFGWDRS